jgi:hypothetical protein
MNKYPLEIIVYARLRVQPMSAQELRAALDVPEHNLFAVLVEMVPRYLHRSATAAGFVYRPRNTNCLIIHQNGNLTSTTPSLPAG